MRIRVRVAMTAKELDTEASWGRTLKLRDAPRALIALAIARPISTSTGPSSSASRDLVGDLSESARQSRFHSPASRRRSRPPALPDRAPARSRAPSVRRASSSACRRRSSPPDRRRSIQSMSSGSLPLRSWPVMYCTRRAVARSVSETPSRAAAPCADVMPGTISTAMLARAAGFDFFAGAPEDQRIAALEPHHAPAGFCERHHQRVDVVLLAGRAVAGLADQHLLRLAARKVEHVARDQIVKQDHVGGLQRAHRAQREQFRIARAGADQGDRAGFRGLRLIARFAPATLRSRRRPAPARDRGSRAR